jgi:urea transport system permease protein
MDGLSFSDFGAVLLMQGFNGLSVFSVLLLMALGLAIIFGQMGVINMAHGEFLTIGAYTTYMFSQLTANYFPSMQSYYFLFAILGAFIIGGAVGYLVELAMVRHLYKRPLDSLLATWGLSLVMQQTFRSVFGAREVSATLPDWLLGSWKPTSSIDIPLNGLFVMALTVLMTGGVALFMYRSRSGLQMRAATQNRVMAGAVGINTARVDRMTFALGCGIAGVAGAAFTTIGSTSPTAGSSYIVDAFLTVVFGGAQSLLGTMASAFTIAETNSTLEFFITGSMAKVITLLAVIILLMLRPEGLFSFKLRK